MNKLQKTLNIFFLNSHLKKERVIIKNNKNYQKLFDEFYTTKKKVEKLYKQAYYWHGTGFYQYQIKGTKYKKILFEKKELVLKKIIDYGGLKPHFDQWIKINGQRYNYSISVTKLRTYARFYAELHNNKVNDLFFTYGKRSFLIKYFIIYTISQLKINRFLQRLNEAFTNNFMKNKGTVWANTINSQLKSKNNALSDLVYVLGKSYSDIPQNFGILIGIKKNAFKPAQIESEFALSESRSLTPINIKKFTHIEVPYNYVEKTKNFLLKNNLSLPVIPIEFGEIFTSKFNAIEIMSQLDK